MLLEQIVDSHWLRERHDKGERKSNSPSFCIEKVFGKRKAIKHQLGESQSPTAIQGWGKGFDWKWQSKLDKTNCGLEWMAWVVLMTAVWPHDKSWFRAVRKLKKQREFLLHISMWKVMFSETSCVYGLTELCVSKSNFFNEVSLKG